MTLTMSCTLNTSLTSHTDARIAEQLGYERVWFYDSPALYADVWAQLCRAADHTERIGLGPGVIVPSLRHPMATAAGIATLVSAAGPDRVAVAIGSGFTGRMTLGQRSLPWSYVAAYVRALKGLLHGDEVEWDGAIIAMMQPAGFAPERPIRVPILIAAAGPKGLAVAKELGDGVFGAPVPVAGFEWSAALTFGTVLDEGEDPGSERAIAAGGHAATVLLHWGVEHGMPEIVPDGKRWAAAYDAVPEPTRHLALHDGHLIMVNERDRPFVNGELLIVAGAALSPAGWRDKLAQLEEAGATEIAYQPAGPDIARELEAFVSVCG
jgi:5,10-methylenetetrahydromethanopterin reductase